MKRGGGRSSECSLGTTAADEPYRIANREQSANILDEDTFKAISNFRTRIQGLSLAQFP